MKGILSFLLLFLVTHAYGQSRVCSYLSSCGSCASFNTSSINSSSDPSCFSTLSSSGGLGNGVRFRSVIDQYEISYQSQGQVGVGIGVIAATIDRAYREHQARQTLSAFYKNLPEMLDAHHSKLMENLEQQRIEKQDLYPEKTLSLEREYQQIGERLKNITVPSAGSQDGTVLPEIEAGVSSREIVKRVEHDDFLRSFPSLADDIIPDRGAREERRNLKIQDEDIKRRHKNALTASSRFRSNSQEYLAEKLLNEARDLRRGQPLNDDALISRVESFELTRALIEDKRSLLKDKIRDTVSPSDLHFLETADHVASNLSIEAQRNFYQGDLEEGEHWGKVALQVLDVGLGFLPGISFGKDLLEAVTGKNYVTGEKLNSWERVFAIAGVATLGTGSIAKNGIKVFSTISDSLLKLKKLQKEDLLSREFLRRTLSGLNHAKNIKLKSPDILNETYRKELGLSVMEFIPPWLKFRSVVEFVTTEEIKLYRVFSGDVDSLIGKELSESTGRWLTSINPADILKMDLADGEKRDLLKNLLSLPDANLMRSYIEVRIPAGTRLRRGIAGPGHGMSGGGIQYDLIDLEVLRNWVVETRELFK